MYFMLHARDVCCVTGRDGKSVSDAAGAPAETTGRTDEDDAAAARSLLSFKLRSSLRSFFLMPDFMQCLVHVAKILSGHIL